MNIHPIYGPWIALRAAGSTSFHFFFSSSVILDWDQDLPQRIHLENPIPEKDSELEAQLTQLLKPSNSTTWRDWFKMRESIPIGKDWIYSADQIQYHYTGDRKVLKKLLQWKDLDITLFRPESETFRESIWDIIEKDDSLRIKKMEGEISIEEFDSKDLQKVELYGHPTSFSCSMFVNGVLMWSGSRFSKEDVHMSLLKFLEKN